MYLIAFTPNRGPFDPPSQGFVNTLQSAPTRAWRHDFGNVWIVVSSETSASDVYNRLRVFMLDKDRLLVISINNQTQFQGWLGQDAWKWLNEQIGSGALNGK